MVNLRKLTHNNPNLDLVNIKAYAKFGDSIDLFTYRAEKKNSDDNLQKLMHNNPNLDLAKVNAYAKFSLIPLIRSQDIEQKRNFDNNQGP